MLNQLKALKPRTEDGFTLIELMIVVVIIGILAAIAIPIFVNQQKAAVDASMKQDLKTVALAQSTWITKNPTQAGTNDPAVLNELVPSLSNKDTRMSLWVVDGVGYCAVTTNPNSNMTGGDWDAGRYFWYDSALGGISKEITGNPPVGGACDDVPRPTNVRFTGVKWM